MQEAEKQNMPRSEPFKVEFLAQILVLEATMPREGETVRPLAEIVAYANENFRGDAEEMAEAVDLVVSALAQARYPVPMPDALYVFKQQPDGTCGFVLPTREDYALLDAHNGKYASLDCYVTEKNHARFDA